jgi:hypothetical protein
LGHSGAILPQPRTAWSLVLICSRTGRVLSPGESLRVLTPLGFTEGVLDTVTLTGAIRVHADARVHEVALEDVEAVWRLE